MSVASESAGSVETLLSDSAWIAYARFAGDGTLVRSNARFRAVCGGCEPGVALSELVVQGQAQEVARLHSGADLPIGKTNVHFAVGDAAPISLLVSWAHDGEELVLLGEPPFSDLEATQATLVKLNGRVSDLARENAKKSAELAGALDDLRQAQAMLVHREKMAALGQMTAGVAHELNNPLSYVKNNVYLLRRGVDDLLALVNLFGEDLDAIQASNPALFEVIMDTIEAVDLPQMGNRLPELLGSIDEGVDRATELVSGLRTFSRLDEAALKTVDLNESLRSTVEFAGFLLKDAEVELRCDWGELPPVTCSPAQLNQAVLNILTNAVQASPAGGTVRLATRIVSDAEVAITIADDGPGVPEGLFDRIFEPFFTTRSVGEGTGLGLSIAHTVIAAHGGSITAVNADGGGAVFTIHLPLELGAES